MKLNWIAGLTLSITSVLVSGYLLSTPNGGDAIKLAGAPAMDSSEKAAEPASESMSSTSALSVVDPGIPSTGPTHQSNPPPTSYSQQIEAALEGNDGHAAMKAIYLLERCDGIDGLTERTFQQRDREPNPKRRAAFAFLVEDFLRQQRSCQSISAMHQSRRNDLLKIANAGGIQGAALRYLGQSAEIVDADPEAKGIAVRNIQAEARAGNGNAIIMLGIEGESYKLPPESRWAFTAAATWIQRNEGVGIAEIDEMMLTALQLAAMPPDTPEEVVQRVNATVKQLVDAYLANRKKP
ncbi:hypothetical protein [Roseateles sp.]|uniref:hypothetical protein n=1 Tax=Roseateles sp. TaxID=1971397 RepID=UPI0031DFA202